MATPNHRPILALGRRQNTSADSFRIESERVQGKRNYEKSRRYKEEASDASRELRTDVQWKKQLLVF